MRVSAGAVGSTSRAADAGDEEDTFGKQHRFQIHAAVLNRSPRGTLEQLPRPLPAAEGRFYVCVTMGHRSQCNCCVAVFLLVAELGSAGTWFQVDSRSTKTVF